LLSDKFYTGLDRMYNICLSGRSETPYWRAMCVLELFSCSFLVGDFSARVIGSLETPNWTPDLTPDLTLKLTPNFF